MLNKQSQHVEYHKSRSYPEHVYLDTCNKLSIQNQFKGSGLKSLIILYFCTLESTWHARMPKKESYMAM